MSKVVKRMMIDRIQGALGECREVLVLDASRLTGFAANQLRLDLRKKRISMLGVKNAVARRALSEIGLTGAAGALTGACTLVFGSDDIVALSKELTSCCEKQKTRARVWLVFWVRRKTARNGHEPALKLLRRPASRHCAVRLKN